MSPRDPISSLSRDEQDMRAAEFVLGLLDAPEEADTADWARKDPAFAALVEHWRVRFAELDITAPEGAAGPALLARIEQTLDQPVADPAIQPETRAEPRESLGAAPAVPPRRQPQGIGALVAGLWDSLGFWRMAGFASATASLLLAIGLVLASGGRPPQPYLVAVLMGPQGEPAAVVNAYSDGTADLLPLRPIAVPDGRVLEVWTLQDPARGPVSIGLSSEARRIPLDLKSLPRTGPNQLFEITLEPRGGSPTGRPTGPILMKGTTSVAL